MDISQKILSDITVYMKYAKFIPELNRRKTTIKSQRVVRKKTTKTKRRNKN